VAEAEKSLLILVPSYKADDTIIESTKANLALCMGKSKHQLLGDC